MPADETNFRFPPLSDARIRSTVKDYYVISVPVGGQPREFKCQKAHYRLCRCNHKAGAWKMHANLADLTITASDHDLMDVRGDQFTDNRVASSIVRRDGNGLARFPTDGILRIDGRPGDRCGIPCYIKRLLRAHLASAAMADSRNALSPSQEPRKAVERRRRRSEILSQVPNRMIGGEIGEASGRALQERAPVSQRLIQPIEMRAQLIKTGWAPPPSLRRDRYFGRRTWPGLRETPQATLRVASRTRC